MFDDFFNDSYVPSDRMRGVSTMNTDIKESTATATRSTWSFRGSRRKTSRPI
jgi:hypothetical protein